MLVVVVFTMCLDVPAGGEQRFFEVPPAMLDRMDMVCLKSGLRKYRLDRFSEAWRVIREGRGNIEAEVSSLLKTLPGIRTML